MNHLQQRGSIFGAAMEEISEDLIVDADPNLHVPAEVGPGDSAEQHLIEAEQIAGVVQDDSEVIDQAMDDSATLSAVAAALESESKQGPGEGEADKTVNVGGGKDAVVDGSPSVPSGATKQISAPADGAPKVLGPKEDGPGEGDLKVGEISAQTAAMTNVVLESIYERLETKRPLFQIVATESADSPKPTYVALEVIEGIKKTVVDIWKYIQALVKKIVAGIKDYFGSMQAVRSRLLKRADDLHKRAREIKGEPGDTALKGPWVTKLVRDGKLSKADLASVLNESLQAMPSALDTYTTIYGETLTNANLVGEYIATGEAEGFEYDESKFRKFFVPLFGNRALAFTGPEASAKGVEALNAVAKVQVNVSKYERGNHFSEIAPLTSNEVILLARDIRRALHGQGFGQASMSYLSELEKRTQGYTNTAATVAGKAEDAEGIAVRSKQLGKAMTNSVQTIAKVYTVLLSDTISGISAMLDYAEASLASVEAPASEAPPAGEAS